MAQNSFNIQQYLDDPRLMPELQVYTGLEIYAVILGLMVVIQHRENIGRLLRGEENKISFKKSKK